MVLSPQRLTAITESRNTTRAKPACKDTLVSLRISSTPPDDRAFEKALADRVDENSEAHLRQFVSQRFRRRRRIRTRAYVATMAMIESDASGRIDLEL